MLSRQKKEWKWNNGFHGREGITKYVSTKWKVGSEQGGSRRRDSAAAASTTKIRVARASPGIVAVTENTALASTQVCHGERETKTTFAVVIANSR